MLVFDHMYDYVYVTGCTIDNKVSFHAGRQQHVARSRLDIIRHSQGLTYCCFQDHMETPAAKGSVETNFRAGTCSVPSSTFHISISNAGECFLELGAGRGQAA